MLARWIIGFIDTRQVDYNICSLWKSNESHQPEPTKWVDDRLTDRSIKHCMQSCLSLAFYPSIKGIAKISIIKTTFKKSYSNYLSKNFFRGPQSMARGPHAALEWLQSRSIW